MSDPSSTTATPVWKRIAWLLATGLWLITAGSLISFSPADWPSHVAVPHPSPPANWCGRFGAALAYHLYLMLGQGVWVLLAATALFIVLKLAGRRVDQVGLRATGVALVTLAICGAVHLFRPEAGPMPEGSGGLVAIASVAELYSRFSFLGSVVLLAIVFGVGAMLAADELVLAAPRAAATAVRERPSLPPLAPLRLASRLVGRSKTNTTPAPERSDDGKTPSRRADRPPAVPVSAATETDATQAVSSVSPTAAAADPSSEDEAAPEPTEAPAAEEPEDPDSGAESETETYAPAETEEEGAPATYLQDKSTRRFDPEAVRARVKQLPVSFAPRGDGKQASTEPPQQDLSGYQFPSSDLLAEPESNFSEEMADLVRQQAEILETALKTYKIDAQVVAIDAGPVITLYEVQLARGTKVSQINTVASDLARELKAPNVRIVPNQAGKSTVGIEVPNPKKEKVRLKELMQLSHGANGKMRLPMFLGKDASGNPLVADLSESPHLLLAGTTGSGKSVCMNAIIMSFLYTRRPDELKLVLVDPKMVEMSQFKDIPHIMCPVVTEMDKAAAILEWAVTKMDERYELLAEAGVRDIDGYNALSWEELKEIFEPASEAEEAKIPKQLPRLVFIIDELADLIMTHREVEGHIVRIAQKARAVGIHLIVATQRPQANVVTGLIKSNMPCRISFKVASGMDSRIVLDVKGAELLLGQGDMLFVYPGTTTRAQGALVDEREVRETTRFLKKVADQSFEPQLMQLKSGQVEDQGDAGERDELFEPAVETVLESGRGSVSLLQRRLGVGYSRAARLIEQMGDAGIIGGYKGSQAREVNMTLDEWKTLKAEAEAEAAAEQSSDGAPEQSGEPAAEADDEGVPDELDGEHRL